MQAVKGSFLVALMSGALLMTPCGVGAQEPQPEGTPGEEAAKETAAKEEAATDKSGWEEIWKRVKLGTVWYLSYGFGEKAGAPYNKEQIGRGYVTLKIAPIDWFRSRVTLDTHQDETGDFKVRLKYMYGEFVVPIETDYLSEPSLEFGLVHGPWFDFEEHINIYRAQGTMFIERNGVLNSADVGATATILLGRKLPADYQKKVSKQYPGSWGSVQFGVYNGGGYHASEENQNKVFESRISLRPLGPWLPGLQLSHFFVGGKGNTEAEPDWMLNAFMASFEHEYFTAAAQAAFGRGNQKGDKIDENGDALESLGFSGFLELKLPWIRSALMGRYDWWRWEDDVSQRFIVGYAFFVYKWNFLLLDLDRVRYDTEGRPDDWQAKLTLQVYF
jgi:hypothetical protein